MSDKTKGNLASRAMEAILTSGEDSAGTSPEAWQRFLIDTMTAISGPLARHMLDRIGLNAAAAPPFRLLDHGCGLGVVAPVLMETVPREVLGASSVVCADNSAALVEAVKGRIEREGWVGCEARVVDAQDSGLPSESFTHVVANIMFHLVPDSEAALKDSIRLLKPGGTLALTTWHECNPAWIAYVRDAFASFPTSLLPADYTFRLPMQTSPWGRWDDVNWLRATLASPAFGLEADSVRVDALASTWSVDGVDHFMRTLGTMIDVAADAALGAESVARLGGHEGVRRRVRGYLEERFGGDGWTLVGVSICAWGRKKTTE